jgi:hypothetical protein
VSKPTIARVSPESESEVLRRRLEEGSFNLRGVMHILLLLEQDLDDDNFAAISTVRLLARIVDGEADAMGDAEAFLNGKAVA